MIGQTISHFEILERLGQGAVVGPLPFGTPFTILCALTLVSVVVGIFAAAAALPRRLPLVS